MGRVEGVVEGARLGGVEGVSVGGTVGPVLGTWARIGRQTGPCGDRASERTFTHHRLTSLPPRALVCGGSYRAWVRRRAPRRLDAWEGGRGQGRDPCGK